MPPLQVKKPDDQTSLGVTQAPVVHLAPVQVAQTTGNTGTSAVAGAQLQNNAPLLSPAQKFTADVQNFTDPFAQAAKSTAVGLGQVASTPYNAAKLAFDQTANRLTGRQPNAGAAAQNANTQTTKDVNTAKSFAQFVPRAVVQLRNSVAEGLGGNAGKQQLSDFRPSSAFQRAVFGNQPIPSLQAVYKNANQQGGTAGALGTTAVTGLSDIAALYGVGKAGAELKEKAIPLDERGSVGKPNEPTEPVKPSAPERTPEQVSLDNTAPPVHLQRQGQGVTPDMITDKDRAEASYSSTTPEELVGRRQAAFRSTDGERAALDTLQQGGTKAEAIKAYQQITGESHKMAAYRVQVAARQAETALHPNAEGVNPLKGTLDIDQPKDGDYRGVQLNANKVEGRIDSAYKDVASFKSALTKDDKANFRDYVEGTRDIGTADDPRTVTAAVQAAKNLTDTVHALDPIPVRYIKDFFPNYWDVADDPLKAEQQLEEEMGPEAWNNMSLDERREALAERTQTPLGGDTNYGSDTERGFHSKARVFANAKEGENAGYNHLNPDPFDDLQRYATGAKLDMKAKVVRRAVDSADASRALAKGAPNTIDLGGGKSIKVSDKGYRALRGMDVKDARGPVAKAWQGLTSAVTQFIVLNPTIHGANLGVQGFIEAGKRPLINADGLLGKIPSGPIGGVRYIGNTVRLLADKGARQRALNRYLSDGGHVPTYGANSKTILTQAADAAHLPHFSKANATAMSKIDGLFRAAAHDDDLRMGVEAAKSVRNIDNFMGDQRAVPEIAHNAGLFYHWVRTEVNAVVHTAISPGALANTAALLAVMYGLNKAWQDWTGNKNASVRYPGDLGLIKEGYNAVTKHDKQSLTTPITNHVNPLLTAFANQAFGKDQFTGQELRTGKQRAGDLLSTTVAPSQGVQKVMSGKKSKGEEALNLFGFYTPHAKNAPAMPNATGKVASLVNTPGAKPVKIGNDKTGYSQEINWYQARSKATNAFGPEDQKNVDLLNAYLDKNHTNTGKTILNNGPQSEQNAKLLAANDAVRQQVQQLEKSQPNHDPKWDLPPAQLKTYMQYESLTPGEKARTVMEQKNPWLVQTFADEQTRFNKQQFSGNIVYPPDYVAYPNISSSQQSMMTQVTNLSKIDNRSTDQQNQLNTLEQNPDLQTAYGLLLSYTNKRRAQDGLQPIAADTQLTPDEEKALQYESSLPSKTGAKTAFIKANQDLWNNIQNKLAQITMQSIASNGAIVYEGGTPSNSYLKDIYNAGQYDIAKGTNAAGQSSFTVNPGLAYSGGTDNKGFTYAGSSGKGKGGKSSSKKMFLPKAHTIKVRKMKLRKAPKQRNRVKLAKPQHRLNINPARTLQPVNVARPTAVVKLAQ